MPEDIKDETFIVAGTTDDLPMLTLETIRQTYNHHAELVNQNSRWTINMKDYCKDVGFLLCLVECLIKQREEERGQRGGYVKPH